MVVARRRELALRMVLGANPRRIVLGVLREGWGVMAAGAVGGALVADRLLRSITGGVTALDPLLLLATLTVVGSLTTLAAWWPARRAAAIDPASVLREA